RVERRRGRALQRVDETHEADDSQRSGRARRRSGRLPVRESEGVALPPTTDTIAAIATAPGTGAVGIVRVSGPDAYAVADAVFRPASGARPSGLGPGRVVFGRVARDGEVVDEALLLTFRAPASYTGQDVIELQTHGGPAVLR